MTLSGRLRALLLPVPRRPLSWRAALHLLVFLALVPAAWLVLEGTGVVAFSTWTPLLLLLLLAPWIFRVAEASNAGLSAGRARVALWSRFLLLGLLATILAEPRAVRTDARLTVMFAVDHSSSVAAAKRSIRCWSMRIQSLVPRWTPTAALSSW